MSNLPGPRRLDIRIPGAGLKQETHRLERASHNASAADVITGKRAEGARWCHFAGATAVFGRAKKTGTGLP